MDSVQHVFDPYRSNEGELGSRLLRRKLLAPFCPVPAGGGCLSRSSESEEVVRFGWDGDNTCCRRCASSSPCQPLALSCPPQPTWIQATLTAPIRGCFLPSSPLPFLATSPTNLDSDSLSRRRCAASPPQRRVPVSLVIFVMTISALYM